MNYVILTKLCTKKRSSYSFVHRRGYAPGNALEMKLTDLNKLIVLTQLFVYGPRILTTYRFSYWPRVYRRCLLINSKLCEFRRSSFFWRTKEHVEEDFLAIKLTFASYIIHSTDAAFRCKLGLKHSLEAIYSPNKQLVNVTVLFFAKV